MPFVVVNYLAFTATREEGPGRVQRQDSDETGPLRRPCTAGSVTRGSTVLVVVALLLTLGAGFRTVLAYVRARPADDPAWCDSKACFYVFNFVTVLGVIYLYVVARVDRTFYVPAIEVERERSEEAA